ncbi:SDR family oxidoreductase [Rhodobacter sp. CZR27]|uniref:SDR family NAD(P)-dependent oxidoreductase n=1 Tax=Rhodobacter sp. CZR27 TaxID=2033869 RepID=UPI000BBED30A|nr:SDR family NAD(P)-dependent oxidoreductase [Rhodobacter sp. CZR27]
MTKLAVVTGASTGIGYELARFAVEDGHALVICADEEAIETAAEKLRRLGGTVEVVRADLSTREGVETLWAAIEGRDIDLFFANAGRALGHAFHEQDWTAIRRLIDLNIRQTTLMLHRVGAKMQARGSGRILVTGSIGGFVPGPYDAVYNGTKAYLDSLCYAVQDEWRDSPVTLTCLMPGPTDTPIFHRPENQLSEAPIAQSDSLDDVTKVARAGYDAMMAGERGVVPGFTNKLAVMLSGLVPQSLLARIHRSYAEPK